MSANISNSVFLFTVSKALLVSSISVHIHVVWNYSCLGGHLDKDIKFNLVLTTDGAGRTHKVLCVCARARVCVCDI